LVRVLRIGLIVPLTLYSGPENRVLKLGREINVGDTAMEEWAISTSFSILQVSDVYAGDSP